MTYTPHQGELVATHWGTYRAECKNGRLISLQPFEADEDPSPIANGLIDTLDDRCRIGSPMVRRSFLKSGIHADRSRRGAESFVSVPWKDALDLTAQVLRRTRDQYGNEAVYAGSYGWASAGRFHHPKGRGHLPR
jgi:biotin/methionine sulfoxide reductase